MLAMTHFQHYMPAMNVCQNVAFLLPCSTTVTASCRNGTWKAWCNLADDFEVNFETKNTKSHCGE